MVAGILQIAHILPRGVVQAHILRPIEHLLEHFVQPLADLRFPMSECGEAIGVDPCFKSALHTAASFS